MIQIPIQAIPNQDFSINLDGSFYDIAIKTTHGVMSVSLSRDAAVIITNLRAVAFGPIIPSRYEEKGNFTFITLNGQLPDYKKFNVTQNLVYFTADELAAFRTPAIPPIPAESFNPIAALPLRFSPQGY